MNASANFRLKTAKWFDSLNVWIDSDNRNTSHMNNDDWYDLEKIWIDSKSPGWRLIGFRLKWIDSV